MRNWEKLIYSMIDGLLSDERTEIQRIEQEILNAYRFEFIDDDTKDFMLDYLHSSALRIGQFREIQHEQRMYDLALNQERLKRQNEAIELLKKADDEWVSKNVKKGRPRSERVYLTYKSYCDSTQV